jgi:leucyl-tRNA synthetase
MEFTNYLDDVRSRGAVSVPAWKAALETLMLMIAPSAPHLAEELWIRSGHSYSIHNQSWPVWEEKLTQVDQVTLVIQINGKLRDRFPVSVSVTEDEATRLAFESPKVKPHLEGKQVVKVIYVAGKLVNLVVK